MNHEDATWKRWHRYLANMRMPETREDLTDIVTHCLCKRDSDATWMRRRDVLMQMAESTGDAYYSDMALELERRSR